MTETRHSVCALDCPDTCSLLIDVDPQGRGSRLRGNPDHPVTRGFLCGKVARYLERNYHRDRLMHPLKRVGAKGKGEFTRVSWDEAIETIAANLRRVSDTHGPEAIMPYSYAGTMGRIQGNSLDRRFFHRLGASRLDRTICSSAGGAGLNEALGFRYGTEPEMFVHAKLIVAWGANIHGTNVHLWPFIVEARRKGAKLYTIDPILTRTAALADRHFYINPGSDLALALGLMHVIIGDKLYDAEYVDRHTTGFEELKSVSREYTPAHVSQLTGIAAEDIVSLAREYASTRPAVIRVNYGIQRSERGGRAMQAVATLPALTGSWRDVGGGLQGSTSQAHRFNTEALERPDLQLRSPLKREARVLNMSLLGTALTEQNVHALVVYNSNPAAIAPHQNRVRQGLRREDLFTVVLEHFLTDTADFADIVLPATTFLEHTDLYLAYGHYHVQMARPALDSPGECKPNTEIFRLLAARLGFDDPELFASDDDLIRDALSSGHEFLDGITLERLEREHSVRLKIPAPFLPFAAPEHKMNLGGEALRYTPPAESRHGAPSKYPLEMVSSKHDDAMNSTFGYRPEVDRATAVAKIHPNDAALRAISNGDRVRVFNDRGSLTLRAEISPGLRSGVVRIPSVRWGKLAEDAQTVNVLTSERLTDIGGGATFYNCLVEVERCGD
ncbi:MAG: molybdopterin-dependent oxidoreductase [Bryobacteraceae bacterium]|nr:molybdopterin-dependent oxidoreductase [Bryobacteraceae bacterium]